MESPRFVRIIPSRMPTKKDQRDFVLFLSLYRGRRWRYCGSARCVQFRRFSNLIYVEQKSISIQRNFLAGHQSTQSIFNSRHLLLIIRRALLTLVASLSMRTRRFLRETRKRRRKCERQAHTGNEFQFHTGGTKKNEPVPPPLFKSARISPVMYGAEKNILLFLPTEFRASPERRERVATKIHYIIHTCLLPGQSIVVCQIWEKYRAD